MSASDRRILLTQWVAEAVRRVNVNANALWRYFEKTGCLLTLDGSSDELTISGKWQVQFKGTYIGHFDDEDDAAGAHDQICVGMGQEAVSGRAAGKRC